MKITEVRVTPGFALPCEIIFAQGPCLYYFDDFQTAFISKKYFFFKIMYCRYI